MVGPLTEAQKTARANKTALKAVNKALTDIVDLHKVVEVGGLKYCELCFQNWSCETYRTARAALDKMKGLSKGLF
jgi:hypothetical protein